MASSNRLRRIHKEIQEIQNDKLSQIVVEPAGNHDDLTHLRGSFPGPPDTPYEGGTYYVDIKIATDYPFRPPNMRFETKIWHPNVSSVTVSVCPDKSYRMAGLTVGRAPFAWIPSVPNGLRYSPSSLPSSPSSLSSAHQSPRTRKTMRWLACSFGIPRNTSTSLANGL